VKFKLGQKTGAASLASDITNMASYTWTNASRAGMLSYTEILMKLQNKIQRPYLHKQ
jgi:hypothetical protein